MSFFRAADRSLSAAGFLQLHQHTTMKGNIVTEPASSAAGGWAIGKAIGGVLAIGIVASALGFLVMLPKTPREAAARVLATMAGSALIGPFMVAGAYSRWPEIFGAGVTLASKIGLEPWIGLFAVAAPLLAMSGLPFWWLLGAGVLWLDKRKGKDLGELARDAASDAKSVLP
jgi:hypothetical protein